MAATALKNILPAYLKHPVLATTHWYWRMRGLPAQSRGDLAIFKEILSKVGSEELRIFEWGSGASTIYYSEFLKASGRRFDWYAADNSKEWRQRVQEKVNKSLLTEHVHLYCSEFPAFWELPGYSYDNPVPPKDFNDAAAVAEYVEYPKTGGGRFDVMMVDGRYRRRCLQVAAEVISPQGIVILHDAQRTHYHPSLDLYPHMQFLETGVLPGTNQISTIALASLEGGSFISELAEKYLTTASSGKHG